MNTFNRILLGMDGSEMDLQLLDYLKILFPHEKPEKIFCTQVVRKLDLPRFLVDDKGDLTFNPIDERLGLNLKSRVEQSLKPEQFEINCDILEGSVTNRLLNWSKIKEIDLTLLGRKKANRGTGISAKRVLRKSPSSFLFVPQGKQQEINKISLATDFSRPATYALLKIHEWMESFPADVKLNLLHVYDVPFELKNESARPQLLNKIRQSLERFTEYYLDSLGLNKFRIELRLIENHDADRGRNIYVEAKKWKTDLLIMGAIGHSTLENLILGSVSEKVLEINYDLPILFLRPKSRKELEKLKFYSFSKFDSIRQGSI